MVGSEMKKSVWRLYGRGVLPDIDMYMNSLEDILWGCAGVVDGSLKGW